MYTELVRVDLNLLVVFSAVAETGSTTEAAKKLNLSQPAVSHALRRLLRDSLDIFRPAAFDPATTTRTFRVALSDYPDLMFSGALAQAVLEQAPGALLDFEKVTR